MQFVRPQVQGHHDNKVKQRRSCIPKLKSNAMQHCAMLTKCSAPVYASCSILHRSILSPLVYRWKKQAMRKYGICSEALGLGGACRYCSLEQRSS